jgi:hypothetical protein
MGAVAGTFKLIDGFYVGGCEFVTPDDIRFLTISIQVVLAGRSKSKEPIRPS